MKFIHQPLQDAGTQIRLLRIAPAKDDGDDINTTLTFWSLGDSPQYTAVSYTWGATANPRTILLNGCRFEVRENCWHALIQCRQRRIHTHIWIDSICIDQSNISEKSRQVAVMASVFSQATHVSISIRDFQNGETDELNHDSLVTFTMAVKKQLSDPWTMLSTSSTYEESQRSGQSIFSWATEHFADQRKLIYEALCKICRAEYWNRLWILQELVMAKQAFLIYRGHDIDLYIVHMLCIIYIDHVLSALADPKGFNTPETDPGSVRTDSDTLGIRNLHHVLLLVYSPSFGIEKEPDRKRLPLAGVLEIFRHARCSDARDHIYGIMSFIDWQGKPPPTVDYSLSKAEFAVRLLPFYNDRPTALWFARLLVETLELTVDDLEQLGQSMLSSGTKRLLQTKFDVKVPDGIPLAIGAVEDFNTQLRDFKRQNNMEDSYLLGRQCYPVVPECGYSRIKLYKEVKAQSCRSCNRVKFVSKPRVVMHSHVHPGDILFSGLNSPTCGLGMVLKLGPESVYAVVDLAALLSGYKYSVDSFLPADNAEQKHWNSYVTLTAYDLFILLYRTGNSVRWMDSCYGKENYEYHPIASRIRVQHELKGSKLILSQRYRRYNAKL